jgi:hypothetical protein
VKLNDDAARKVIELVESMPWGDIDGHLRAMEHAMRLAIDATREDLQFWEAEAYDAGYDDEFAVDPKEFADMSPQWRKAYIGRLICTLGLCYGVGAGWSGGPAVGQEDPTSVAALVRRLNDLCAWGHTTELGDEPGGA